MYQAMVLPRRNLTRRNLKYHIWCHSCMYSAIEIPKVSHFVFQILSRKKTKTIMEILPQVLVSLYYTYLLVILPCSPSLLLSSVYVLFTVTALVPNAATPASVFDSNVTPKYGGSSGWRSTVLPLWLPRPIYYSKCALLTSAVLVALTLTCVRVMNWHSGLKSSS